MDKDGCELRVASTEYRWPENCIQQQPMSLTEDMVSEQVDQPPKRYASRVRWMAIIYVVLNIISIAIIIAIVWRLRFFITLSQRSNVETLTIAIIFVLAAYYLVSTFRGFIGAMRMLWLNLPALWTSDEKGKARIENGKQAALKASSKSKSAYFDKAVALEGKSGEAIKWQVSDQNGKLGELQVEGVKATYYPIKRGMNNNIFEFLVSHLERAIQKRDGEAQLQITQWSTIDEDQASSYYSMVQAFQSLEGQLGKGRVWPTVEITQNDVDKIQQELTGLVPALRNQSLLPDLEYAVEYNVPVLPEPLGFVKLTRNDNRADAVLTMGCAVFVMLFIMAVLTFFILLPPWVPSK